MRSNGKEVLWTSELAYAVGLITTDGSLSVNGRTIDFTSKDKDLIETFEKCLGVNNAITKKRNGCSRQSISFRVQVGNVTLYRWLLEIGLMARKSKRLGSLKIPNIFFFDFLRGHLDGDGSIKRYQDPVYPKSVRLYVHFISASLPHIVWIRQKIEELSGISGFMQHDSGVYKLVFSKRNSIKLLNVIYYRMDLPCLQRKFAIAKEFLNV